MSTPSTAPARTGVVVLIGVVLGVTLAGCLPTVAVPPAPDAAATECASVIVALPESVDVLGARTTDSQATAAWGEPAAVVLRCGLAPPAPTATLPCITAPSGIVDWLVDQHDEVTVFTSYGRDPAVELVVDPTIVAPQDALLAVDAAVSTLPSVGSCLALEDALAPTAP